MKICMIGAGYVGLVSAACFAEFALSIRVDAMHVPTELGKARSRNQADIAGANHADFHPNPPFAQTSMRT